MEFKSRFRRLCAVGASVFGGKSAATKTTIPTHPLHGEGDIGGEVKKKLARFKNLMLKSIEKKYGAPRELTMSFLDRAGVKPPPELSELPATFSVIVRNYPV